MASIKGLDNGWVNRLVTDHPLIDRSLVDASVLRRHVDAALHRHDEAARHTTGLTLDCNVGGLATIVATQRIDIASLVVSDVALSAGPGVGADRCGARHRLTLRVGGTRATFEPLSTDRAVSVRVAARLSGGITGRTGLPVDADRRTATAPLVVGRITENTITGDADGCRTTALLVGAALDTTPLGAIRPVGAAIGFVSTGRAHIVCAEGCVPIARLVGAVARAGLLITRGAGGVGRAVPVGDTATTQAVTATDRPAGTGIAVVVGAALDARALDAVGRVSAAAR